MNTKVTGNNFSVYFACIAFIIAVGLLGGYFQIDAIKEWYPNLNKPSFTPPGWAISIIWISIYTCMGMSLASVFVEKKRGQGLLLFLFFLGLLVNFVWSFLFFSYGQLFYALICVGILDALVLAYALGCLVISKSFHTAFFWIIPYILWLCIATYFNIAITFAN